MSLVPGVLVLEIFLVGLAPQVLHRQIRRVIILKYVAHPNDSRLFCKFMENFAFMTKTIYGRIEVVPVLWIDPDRTTVEALGNLPWKEFFDRQHLFIHIVPGAIADAKASVAFLTPEDVATANGGALQQERGLVPGDAIEAAERADAVAPPLSPQAILAPH
jgi:hypothetical protein